LGSRKVATRAAGRALAHPSVARLSVLACSGEEFNVIIQRAMGEEAPIAVKNITTN
jgi:hypothetical protein